MSILSVKINGGDELLTNIKLLNVKIRRLLKNVVTEASLNVQNESRRNVIVDTGRLKSSITIDFERNGLASRVGSDVKYAANIEFGTRPHYVPPRALKRWAQRKSLSKGAEFFIASAIAKKGTKPQPFLFPSWEKERPKFKKDIAGLRQKIEKK